MSYSTTSSNPSSPGFFTRVSGATKSYMGSRVHQGGMSWVKDELGIGKRAREFAQKSPGLAFAGRWLGRGFVGFSALEGYREGGITGALGATASHLGTTYAMGAAFKALGIGVGAAAPYLAGAAVIGGIGVGAASLATGVSPLQFLARPYVREHMKKHAKLEMAKPVTDQFGTIATMRQRSVAAMQHSNINARSALAHEAMTSYQPYFGVRR